MRTAHVPAVIRQEVERLGERWRTLPLDQALHHAQALRELARRCEEQLPWHDRHLTEPLVQDLGPECAYDQVSVLVYDLCRHRFDTSADAPGDAWEERLRADLEVTRRSVG